MKRPPPRRGRRQTLTARHSGANAKDRRAAARQRRRARTGHGIVGTGLAPAVDRLPEHAMHSDPASIVEQAGPLRPSPPGHSGRALVRFRRRHVPAAAPAQNCVGAHRFDGRRRARRRPCGQRPRRRDRGPATALARRRAPRVRRGGQALAVRRGRSAVGAKTNACRRRCKLTGEPGARGAAGVACCTWAGPARRSRPTMNRAEVSMSEPERMPAAFIGHGSPMNTLERTPTRERGGPSGAALPRPRAVLAISAHWFIQAPRSRRCRAAR